MKPQGSATTSCVCSPAIGLAWAARSTATALSFAADWTIPEDRRRPGRWDSAPLPELLHEAFRNMNEEEDWRAAPVEEGDLDWRNLPSARGYVPGIFPQSGLL
ncbi:hypothetical protein ACRJ4W_37365 [Streptomyces sp. GLT-R25]